MRTKCDKRANDFVGRFSETYLMIFSEMYLMIGYISASNRFMLSVKKKKKGGGGDLPTFLQPPLLRPPVFLIPIRSDVSISLLIPLQSTLFFLSFP